MQTSSDFLMGFSTKGIGAKVTGIVTDRAIVAVLSASLIAPFFVPRINSVLDSVPFLRDHKSVSSIVAGIVVFGVAKTPRIPNYVGIDSESDSLVNNQILRESSNKLKGMLDLPIKRLILLSRFFMNIELPFL